VAWYKTRQDKTRQEDKTWYKTRQEKRSQDKTGHTRQDKTKQDKTRQGKGLYGSKLTCQSVMTFVFVLAILPIFFGEKVHELCRD
jgi:hypothetical protein